MNLEGAKTISLEDQEDDFIFGNPEKKDPEKKEEGTVDENSNDKSIVSEENVDKQKEDGSKPEKRRADELKDNPSDEFSNNKADEEESHKEEDISTNQEEEEDADKDIKTDDQASFFIDDVDTEIVIEDKKVDLSGISRKIGLSIEDDESIDEEKFLEKIGKLIEDSKQEFKLDGYSDPAKKLIQHINKTGDISSYFLDEKIVNYQQFLSLDSDDKYTQVRFSELSREGKDEDEIQQIIDDELSTLSTREIKDLNDRYDGHIKGLLESRVSEISKVGDAEYQKQIIQTKEKIEEEKKSLKNYISSQEDVLGIKLTAKDKSSLMRVVDSGDMDLVLDKNPEKAKFYAYMHLKFQDRINSNMQKQIAESVKKAKNSTTDKFIETLHETNDMKTNGSSGRSPKTSSERFSSWANENL